MIALETINRIRGDCGISALSTEDFNQMQIQAILQQKQASYESQQKQQPEKLA